MRLSGNLTLDDISQAFQGNFSCLSVTKNNKGKQLPSDEQHIRLELFFLQLDIYKDKIIVYSIGNDSTSDKKLTKIGKISITSD